MIYKQVKTKDRMNGRPFGDAITGMSKWQRLQTERKEFKLGKFTHSKDKDFSREWIC